MVRWFWQRETTPHRTLRLRGRGEQEDSRRVEFEALAPEVETFLGQAAYLQLGFFETLSELIAATPDLDEKESLSRAAGAALLKHRQIVEIVRGRGIDPLDLMLPFREPLDAFRDATHGARPEETMLSVRITAGMLDDFYLALSSSYGDTGRQVSRVLAADDDRQAMVDLLAERISVDDELRSLLSMWGRRLVGDTLLIARAGLRSSALDAAGEKRVEPVFTELLAAHAQRMAALGLAA